jgi:hypothetical protein
MSHRNGKPKPNASERTWRRWRDRHDISTPADVAHRKMVDEVKDKIKEFLGLKSLENVKLNAS